MIFGHANASLTDLPYSYLQSQRVRRLCSGCLAPMQSCAKTARYHIHPADVGGRDSGQETTYRCDSSIATTTSFFIAAHLRSYGYMDVRGRTRRGAPRSLVPKADPCLRDMFGISLGGLLVATQHVRSTRRHGGWVGHIPTIAIQNPTST